MLPHSSASNDNYPTWVFKWVPWDPLNPATPHYLLDLHHHNGEVWPSRYIQESHAEGTSSLPDKGQRLKQACADLEMAIVKLDIAANSYKPLQLGLSAQGYGIPYSSAAHTSGSLQQTSIKQHFQPLQPASPTMAQQCYQQEANTAIRECIEKLHRALETCPSAETEADDPSHLRVTLMPHQKYALAWLSWREDNFPHGGILADEAGLDTTLTMISLVLQKNQEAKAARTAQKGTVKSSEKDEGFIRSTCTLVICPASVIDLWAKEVERCCEPDQLNTYSYHGPNRESRPEELAKYDMVFTSYELVRKSLNDYEEDAWTGLNNPPALLRVFWGRIILDEAHIIKNFDTQTAQMICKLRAQVRWAVTGYPIQNNTMELFSLIRFLKCSPFDEYHVWDREVEKAGPKAKSKTLQSLGNLLLRRTKDQMSSSGNPIVSLPEKKIHRCTIYLSSEEREIYEFLFQQSSSTHILAILLRLRQCCCHPSLLKKPPVQESCEMDGHELDLANQIEELGLDESDDLGSLYEPSFLSSKIKIVINLLEKIRAEGTAEKSALVSQWTGMLDVVASHLTRAAFEYWSIRGDIPSKKRDEAMEDFNNNPSGPKVMLVSLKLSRGRLNLIGGNHLFFLDMHWNPTLEDQVCDSMYRAGQMRSVHIYKFVCSDTIEDKILQLQTKKRQLADDVLGSKEKLSDADLDFLFAIQPVGT